MSKKKSGGGDHDEGGGGHGDRPWVYFMIDSFFLVTQFFVLTFHVRSDEVILPQKLPPGGGRPSTTATITEPKEQINVNIMRNGGKAVYQVRSGGVFQDNSLEQFSDMLATTASARTPDKLSVRISYTGDIPFGDVMPVFNACRKFKIAECGLIPTR